MPAVAPVSATAAGFTIPLHFDALTSADAGSSFVNLDQHSSTSPASLISLSDEQSEESFPAAYALISRYLQLSAADRSSALEAVRSRASRAGNSPEDCKRAAFLLAGLSTTAEGDADAKKRKAWDKTGREIALETARSLLESADAQSSSWAQNDRDQFASVLLRMLLSLLESPAAAKDKATRPSIARVLGGVFVADPAQTLPASAGFIHLLNRHEHVPVPIAEVLQRLLEEFPAYEKFVSDFMQEIARLDPGHLARDATSAKACAVCVGELAERLPKITLANIALLLSMLDGDSYTMRNGILHAIGRLIVAFRDDATQSGTRESMFEILLDRALRDVNAFTRSKAMQTWLYLAEARAIPHRSFFSVAEVASSRLEDKTAAVRRSAAQLLCALLQSNPFGPALRLSHFKAKLAEVGGFQEEAEEEAGEKADEKENGSIASSSAEDDDNKENEFEGNGTAEDGAADVEDEDIDGVLGGKEEAGAVDVEVDEEGDAGAEEEEDVSEEKMKFLFYKSAVDFISSIEAGLHKCYKMLRSTSITDVSESVSLLVSSVQFQLEAASGRAVRAMLPLVLAREVNIRTAAIEAYELLLAPHLRSGQDDALEDKDSALVVANSLISLILGATIGEVACLETLVEQLLSKENSIIAPAVVTILWDMFAGKIPGASEERRCAACMYLGMIAVVRPDSLQSRVHILEEVGLSAENMSYVQWTCVALSKLPAGSDSDGNLCRKLSALVEGENCDVVAAEHALTAIYRLHPAPEQDVSAMVARMAEKLFEPDVAASVPTRRLALFFLVVGHVAIKQLVRVEAMVSAMRKAARKGEEEESGAEADKALEFAESELTSPSSLLGQYGEMVRQISGDEDAPEQVRASAVLCLAKLMCIKSSFCEANLRLLFTVLERAKSATVRANAITSLGDLAFRFPNLVEPWSSHIYAALEDRDVRVRKNALMALSHLILNDMVKVKGQMVGLTLRVLDEDERINELARVFFHELSRKSANAIYNLLPDTISCVSRREDVSSADVKKVMSFLVGFIDKGWQAEGVVDKLCHRFRTSESDQESRDIAYCISQLNLNEKCIGRLADAFKLYAALLVDDEVHMLLSSAVLKAKKTMAMSGGGSQAKRNSAQDGDGGEGRHRYDELLEKMERQRGKVGDDEGGEGDQAKLAD